MNEIQNIGIHRLLCGDITQGAVQRLMGDERADVVYSDPPWGPGNQKYWHTQNARGSAPLTDWPGFLRAFCRSIADVRKPEAPVFVEMGTRWVADLDAAMAEAGLAFRARWIITYGPKNKPLPNVLNLYGPAHVNFEMPSPPHGEPVTRAVISGAMNQLWSLGRRTNRIVLDPCTGLGMTARITDTHGDLFRGTELNPARLARTVAWLQARELRLS